MAALVSRYARAFADVVSAAGLHAATIEAQMNDFQATWEASAELRSLLVNPAVAATRKIEILDQLNTRMGLAKELRNLLAVLIRNDRIAQAGEVFEAYRREQQERMGIRQAEVTTARALDENDREALVAGAGKLAGGRVEATFKLDPSILGGAVVRIGSTVYDGSVRGRLERLKEALVSG